MQSEEETAETNVFPAVTHEMQLQALLGDERSRGQRHKRNYQRLKADYSRLEEEHTELRNELQKLSEELQKTRASSAASLGLAQGALSDKQSELDALKERSLRPTLENRTSNRNATKLSRQLAALETECETLHQELNRQRYQSSMEQAQAQFELAGARRETKELKTRHAIELHALQEVTETLTSSPESPETWRNLRQALERENLLLRSRTEGLLAEAVSLRSDAQRNCAQAEEDARGQLRSLATQATNFRELQSEKQRLQLQAEALQSELTLLRDSHSSVLVKQRNLKRELLEARTQASRAQDDHRAQLQQLEEELSDQRDLVDKSREAAEVRIQSVELELQLNRDSEAKQVALSAEREAKWECRLVTEKEELLSRIKIFEEQKQVLAKQLDGKEAEIRKRDFEQRERQQALEDGLRGQSSALEKEQLQVGNLKKQILDLQEALEREIVQRLESERGKDDAQQKVLEMQKRVKGQTERLRRQAQQTQEALQRLQSGETQETEALRKQLLELEAKHSHDEDQLRKKTEELELQLRSAELSYGKEAVDRRKKIKCLIRQNAKFRLKLSEKKSKDKIKTGSVSAGEHKRVVQRLQDLQSRLNLFGGILDSLQNVSSQSEKQTARRNPERLAQEKTKQQHSSSKKSGGATED